MAFTRRLRVAGAVLAGISLVAVSGAVATPDLPETPGAEAAQSLPVDGGGDHDLELPRGVRPGVPEVAVVPARSSGSSGGTVVSAAVSVGSTGLPARVLAAYRKAAASVAVSDPGCHLTWPLLAAIGQVESGQARGGALRADGTTLAPILGPVLSGGPGIAAISDTDDGRWDGDTRWDRAVGPMQFIPSSWAAYGRDGNGDGIASPHNIDDAALASATYLCAYDRDLRQPAALRQAVFGYNHSWSYVATVLAWMRAYASGVVPTAPAPFTGPASSGQNGNTNPAGHTPSPSPTTSPTAKPTPAPSSTPTSSPTPSGSPTPTGSPTESPTTQPSPTESPTTQPSPSPTTTCPTPSPSPSPSGDPGQPTPTPSPTQVDHATEQASDEEPPPDDGCPTATPTSTPTSSPTPSSSGAAAG